MHTHTHTNLSVYLCIGIGIGIGIGRQVDRYSDRNQEKKKNISGVFRHTETIVFNHMLDSYSFINALDSISFFL